jgi:flavodoxin
MISLVDCLLLKTYLRKSILHRRMINKNLVVYYSYEGNTRLIVQTIAEVLDADIIECKPLKDINLKGFMKYIWGGGQVVFKQHPQLEIFEKNPNDYDMVIIGTPVWAFDYAPAIRSFLSQVTLKNKKIGLFCCHEGVKGKTLDNLKKALSNNTIIGEIDFLNVKQNKEENILKAKNWALILRDR